MRWCGDNRIMTETSLSYRDYVCVKLIRVDKVLLGGPVHVAICTGFYFYYKSGHLSVAWL